MLILNGLLLGLASTAACLGVCAPVLLPYLFSEEKKPAGPLLLFMAGRLTAYLLFALLAGWTGLYFEGRVDPRVFSVLLIVLSAWLIVFSFGKLAPHAPCARLFSGKAAAFPLLAGFVLGLNLCPPFLIGFAQAAAMKSLAAPVVFFLGFYLGSSAWLLPFFFAGALTRNRYVLIAGRAAALAAGLWYLLSGVQALILLTA